MKLLKKIVLINWHYLRFETLELDQINFLTGKNGAGKTTTLRCVATLLSPTEGTVSVCGYDTQKQPDEVRKCIGFLTNEIKLDPHFSPKYLFHFLRYF